MIDPTDFEKACMQKVLRPLGEIVAEIGADRAFNNLTRDQVLTLIEVVVTAYTSEMAKGSPEIPF